MSVVKQAVEAGRCGVCGLLHPFLTVCPFVEEQEVRYELTPGSESRRRVRARIERTRYFPRPQVFEALQEMTTETAE